MRFLLLTVGLFFCSISCFAGDHASFNSLGFSESGDFYAFSQTGICDGSGFPYAQVFVIDVKKNEIVASGSFDAEPPEGEDDNTQSVEHCLTEASKAANLGKFAISADKFPGKKLLERLPTDHSTCSDIVFSTEAIAEGGASGYATRYTLKIETKDTKANIQDIPEDFGAAKLLKLAVSWTEDEKKQDLVILDEKELSQQRPYPLNYSISQIIAGKESIIVVVSYTTPGFEGPDVRYMAFTSPFSCPQG